MAKTWLCTVTVEDSIHGGPPTWKVDPYHLEIAQGDEVTWDVVWAKCTSKPGPHIKVHPKTGLWPFDPQPGGVNQTKSGTMKPNMEGASSKYDIRVHCPGMGKPIVIDPDMDVLD
jgi:hypothetical protein